MREKEREKECVRKRERERVCEKEREKERECVRKREIYNCYFYLKKNDRCLGTF